MTILHTKPFLFPQVEHYQLTMRFTIKKQHYLFIKIVNISFLVKIKRKKSDNLVFQLKTKMVKRPSFPSIVEIT